MRCQWLSLCSGLSLFLFSFNASALRCDRVITRGVQLAATHAVVNLQQRTLLLDGPAGQLIILSVDSVNPYDRVAVDFDRARECSDSSSSKTDGSHRLDVLCSADGGISTASIRLTVAHDRKSAEYRGVISVVGYEEFDFEATFLECHD